MKGHIITNFAWVHKDHLKYGHIMVNYDGTMRNSLKNVIQFLYEEDDVPETFITLPSYLMN
jgi:hypothetical protein